MVRTKAPPSRYVDLDRSAEESSVAAADGATVDKPLPPTKRLKRSSDPVSTNDDESSPAAANAASDEDEEKTRGCRTPSSEEDEMEQNPARQRGEEEEDGARNKRKYSARWYPAVELKRLVKRVLYPALDAVSQQLLLLRSTDPAGGIAHDTSIRSLRYQTLASASRWGNFTIKDDLGHLALKCVPLHSTCAVLLTKLAGGKDEDDVALAQTFVTKDKLGRIVAQAAKKDKSGGALVDRLLAVDGLASAGDVRGMPNYDAKRYVERLRFGIRRDEDEGGEDDDDEGNWWSHTDVDEREHVRAVRHLYQILADENRFQAPERKSVIFRAMVSAYAPHCSDEQVPPGYAEHEQTREREAELFRGGKRLAKIYAEMIDNEERMKILAEKFFQPANRTSYRKKKKMNSHAAAAESEEDDEEIAATGGTQAIPMEEDAAELTEN